jgi:hypothetical protein
MGAGKAGLNAEPAEGARMRNGGEGRETRSKEQEAGSRGQRAAGREEPISNLTDSRTQETQETGERSAVRLFGCSTEQGVPVGGRLRRSTNVRRFECSRVQWKRSARSGPCRSSVAGRRSSARQRVGVRRSNGGTGETGETVEATLPIWSAFIISGHGQGVRGTPFPLGIGQT